jgi:hypothetical protein
MKSKLIVNWAALVTLGLAFGMNAFADTDGFRGLKWGTDFETVKNDMNYAGTDRNNEGTKIYTKKDDELRIGGAKLEGIEYYFWQDKFSSVYIKFKGDSNFSALKNAAFEKFGPGKKTSRFMEDYMWPGEITGMGLKYDQIGSEGMLYMFSLEINKQKRSVQTEKVKKGAQTGF